MKIVRTYLVLVPLFVAACCFAQDVHFSQYYFSPLSLNPSNTGNFKGDHRFFGNYRSQWREISRAYDTYSAGGDFNIYPRNLNVSGGLIVIKDQSGGNLSVTKIMPSAAWHVKLLGYKFRIGIQPGMVIKAIDFYSHTFPNQLNWSKGGFDNTLPNNETNVGQRFTYFDLNTGFGVNKKFKKWEADIGYALFHINKPTESFLSNRKNHLPVRQAYNFGLNYSLKRNLILKFHSLYGYTHQVSDWVSGLTAEYILSQDVFFSNSVFAGVMWRAGIQRNPDAGIVTIGLNYEHYTIGFSYDITFSQLRTSVDSKGAFEIAFIYRGKSTRLNKKVIPCERY